jgi:hypothetical protein
VLKLQTNIWSLFSEQSSGDGGQGTYAAPSSLRALNFIADRSLKKRVLVGRPQPLNGT